jgi:fructose 1,6-bisphosphatase
VAAVTSSQRLSLMAGRHVGKDDPVMIVCCQFGLPADAAHAREALGLLGG